MKKGFLFLIFMLACLALHAQTKPAPAEAEEKAQEAPPAKNEAKGATPRQEAIKAVPAAKSQHAKPVHINKKKNGAVRPAKGRPARSRRPAVRVIKPGRGM